MIPESLHFSAEELEKLDFVQMEQLFLSAKELLRILNDLYSDFPYHAYFNGSSELLAAAAWCDNAIHGDCGEVQAD